MGEKEQAKRSRANFRREHVRTGLAAGKSQAQMARELSISPERVNQLVKEHRHTEEGD